MLVFPVAMLWISKGISSTPITDRTLCTLHVPLDHPQISNKFYVVTTIYPGIFTSVGVLRGALGLVAVYLKWAQTVRDKEFLVEMRLRNLELEEAREKLAEKKEEREQEQGEAPVQDLPVLDLIENQSDGESDNEEERFLL
jgi:hypothetical protein